MNKPYQTRITRMTILPEGDPIFSEIPTHIEVEDEAAGEFLVIRQCNETTRPDSNSVSITPEEWPMVKAAVDQMMDSLLPIKTK